MAENRYSIRCSYICPSGLNTWWYTTDYQNAQTPELAIEKMRKYIQSQLPDAKFGEFEIMGACAGD